MSDPNELNDYKDALGAAYSHANAYSNVIIGAGYAGFFAIWALTKDHLNDRQMAWAGLLIAVSILFFVIFEIIKMVYSYFDLEKQAQALSRPDQYKELLAAHRNAQSRIALQLRIQWYFFFSISLLTGLGAAGIVLWLFLRQLLKCT